VWHFNLVTQLVARFYVEKRSGRQLREMAYLQAVHETGARVTHDVKNLLQSLHALLFVIGKTSDGSSPKAQTLLRRQLPLIAQRLQQTLEKLRAPEDVEQEETVSGAAWWRELRARYEGRDIRFVLHGDSDGKFPAALFNSAAENLLQNALEKRAVEPGIEIVIALDMRNQPPVLSVRDSGAALSEERARDVGHRPVASENGLGIGLYQLARLAGMVGYALVLSSNRPGEVVFSLQPETLG
jgi:K+-sensing histidine kinase KdpD